MSFSSLQIIIFINYNVKQSLSKGENINMIHKDLCRASFTKHHTVLRIQFNFLLSTVHTWEGEIPLTACELAEKLGCHVGTMRRLIAEALCDGVLRQEGGRLYFTKCVEDPKKGYVRHFPFLSSPEFRKEDIQVIRFVLEVLTSGAYSSDRLFHAKKVELYHRLNKKKEIVEEGRFNIYFPGQLKEIIEKAKKYLIFADTPNHVVRVVGLRPEWDQAAVKNVGEQYAFLRILKRFGLGDVATSALEELVKVKDQYRNLGVEMAKSIVDEALLRALNQEGGKFISLLLSNKQREIYAYFQKVCDEVEQERATTLVKRKEQLKRALQFSQLWIQRKLQFAGELLVAKGKEQLQKLQAQIQLHENHWLQQSIKLGKKDSERQKQYLVDRENHPLFKGSQWLKKCIDMMRLKTEPAAFPFYNWLEQN
jgi:hypothetical protein